MKIQTHTNFVRRASLTLALALALLAPVQAQSTAPAKGMMMKGKMADRCEEMMEQKHKMMADMKAQDTELTAQVARMNSASDDKKIELMAAVVTQMAEQRTAISARMEKGHDEMMKHMSEHMNMGDGSMSQCPMMKDMGGMNEKSANAHKEHPEEKK